MATSPPPIALTGNVFVGDYTGEDAYLIKHTRAHMRTHTYKSARVGVVVGQNENMKKKIGKYLEIKIWKKTRPSPGQQLRKVVNFLEFSRIF